MKNFTVRYLLIFAAISFLLHIFWENFQAPLYASFVSFPSHFLMCLSGTFGDVAISIGVLLFMILIKQTWPQRLTKKDFTILAIMGLTIAVVIEQIAHITGRWSYANAMPLIPFLHVGLTPILQMTFLLPLSFYLAQKLSNR